MTSDATNTTPDYLLPKMEDVPVSEPAFYRSLFILEPLGASNQNTRSSTKPLDGPIDAFDTAAGDGETRPAVGVLTVHKQVWTQRGIALGNLLQSICLAPGEVTQVAVIDWQRSTRGTSVQATDQSEAVSSEIDQQRAVNEVQKGVASETQAGNSSTLASSVSAQAGVSGGGLLFAGSASTAGTNTRALAAQFSTGARNLAVESSNALTQKTAEHASSLRSRRSSVVREIAEQESERLASRVVANYNRRHALNIEYFEVLQLYGIETTLAAWERCLFVPLKPIDFSQQGQIGKHHAALLAIFTRLQRPDLIERLRATADQTQLGSKLDKDITRLEEQASKDEADVALHAPLISVIARAMALLAVSRSVPEDVRQQVLADVKAMIAPFPSLFTNDSSTEKEADLLEKQRHEAQLVAQAQGRLAATRDTLGKLRTQRAALDLSFGAYLNSDRLFLSQQIWLGMDAFSIYQMLSHFTLGGQPLSRQVDPHPVGIFGNYLAFRWGFGRSPQGEAERTEFEKTYLKATDTTAEDPTVVALPTTGVFAEAVLGRGEAAEKKDESLFREWDKSPIPILPPKIADIVSRDRSKTMELGAGELAASLAALRATNPADVSHLAGLLQQLGSGTMFRDNGGLAQVLTLADKVAALSGSGATEAGNRSQKIHEQILKTFVDVLNSDAGQAVVSELMLPGSGAALLGQKKLGDGSKGSARPSGSKAGSAPAPATPSSAESDEIDKILNG